MYGVGDSHRDSSTNTNLLFSSSTFKDGGEFIKNPDLYQQQQQQSSSLMRYSSAPSSFLASLVDGCDDFLNPHHHHQEQSSSSPDESELFARLVPNDDSDPPQHNLQQFGSTGLKQEETQQQEKERDQYSTSTFQTGHHHQIHQRRDLGNHSSLSNNSCSNLLLRQSSSPAGFFSDLATENGFGVMRDVGNFGVGSGTNNGKSGPTSRLNNHINFSSGPSSGLKFMPPIVENGNESIEAGSLENGNLGNGNSNKRYFVPSFQNDPWNGSGFTGLKRSRDDDEKKFSGFNALENQNGNSRNFSTGLTHHLSLPKTSAEMATMEKFVQFQQDSVPCKIRAKRGFATHPRSIAERVRRTRISERMRKLQELFPNMDKQTNTADMLDLAVEYIKDLQKQVKTLTDTRVKCTCSSQQKQSSNPAL